MSDIGPTPRPEQDESYWLEQKLNIVVRHLREIEDYNRSSWAGLPERFEGSFQEARADRARSIYEQITSDFFEGNLILPTMKQQLEITLVENEYLTDAKNAGWAISQARLKIINSMHENLTEAKKVNGEYHTLFHKQEERIETAQAQVKALCEMLEAAGALPIVIETIMAISAITEV